MNQRILIIIIVLLAALSAYLGWKVSQQKEVIVYQTETIKEGVDEREVLQLELEQLKLGYDTLKTDNSMLMAEIDAQKMEIEELLKKVKDKNWSITKLKKEADTLREIMKGYVATIDSLNTLNQALIAENAEMKQTVQTVTSEKEELAKRSATQEKIIATGQILQAVNVSTAAVTLRNSGKQVDTDRASKAEMIKSCFTLIENKIAKPGTKNLYLRIIDPNGKALAAKEGEVSRDFEGESGKYSIKREIDYNNSETDVCIFYTVQGELTKGAYKVYLYEDGNRIAESDFTLK
jgi:hypothetical protein